MVNPFCVLLAVLNVLAGISEFRAGNWKMGTVFCLYAVTTILMGWRGKGNAGCD